MVVVGDSSDVFLISVNQNEEEYSKQYQLTGTLSFPAMIPGSDGTVIPSTGCGFSVSWNQTGTLFAVAQQYPGKVAVWDWPGKRLLHLFGMLHPGNECRSVQFFEPEGSKASILMFVEKNDHVHFVDLEKQLRQTLTLPVLLVRGFSSSQIGGAAVTKRGQLFVGRSGGMYEYHLVGLRTLKDTCLRFIKSNVKIWGKEKLQRLPLDILEHIQQTG